MHDDDAIPDARRFAPAASRNRAPIFEVLAPWLATLAGRPLILEIGCGTGEHAAFIAPRRPALRWQPSDPTAAARESADAWARHVGATNILPAIDLDAAAPTWPIDQVDAIVAVNVVHISPWSTCLGIFAGAARCGAALVFLYGPYTVDGAHTAPSNAAFDADLRARDPAWGVRDRGAVAAVADAAGFDLVEIAAMPANNFSLVFRRRGVDEAVS